MISREQLERRIEALESKLIKNKKESLESRVAKLEKMLLEDDAAEQPKSSKDYLMILLNMLFKSRKVNPKGNSLEENYHYYENGRYPRVTVLNMAIGDWEFDSVADRHNIITDDSIDPKDYGPNDVAPIPGKPGRYAHPNTPDRSAYYTNDSYTLTNEVEIKKIIGAFCKIHKCIIDFNQYASGDGTDLPVLEFTLKKSPTFQAPKYRRQWGDSDSDWETLADQERRHNSLYHGWC